MARTKALDPAERVYQDDLRDLALVLIATVPEATSESVLAQVVAAIPEERHAALKDVLAKETTRGAKYVSVSPNGRLNLSELGQQYMAKRRFPEGVPPAISVVSYACETKIIDLDKFALDLRSMRVLGVFAAYNDELTIRQIKDQLNRQNRNSDASVVHDVIGGFLEHQLVEACGNNERGYMMTDLGGQVYEQCLGEISHGSTSEDPPAAFILHDLKRVLSEPLLANTIAPPRVSEALQQAALALTEDIMLAVEDAEWDPEELWNEHLMMLPKTFHRKYDRAFLERFKSTVERVVSRLKTETRVEARTIAEAMALRDIVSHAKDIVVSLGDDSVYPVSRRERNCLLFIEATVWSDSTFQALFEESEAAAQLVAASSLNESIPDLTFDDWFSPFSEKQIRVAERYANSSKSFIEQMEQMLQKQIDRKEPTDLG